MPDAPLQPSPLPPRCAARYECVSLLGSGAHADVYLATQTELSRPVAIKLLRVQGPGNGDEQQRLVDEARLTASLAHANIVRVLDLGLDEGVPWIAYEYVGGGSLRQRLAGGRLPWPLALGLAGQVALALEVAHAAGIVHRDVKPENVLLAAPDRCKIGDFGIAKWSSSAREATAAGIALGTPAYMAPEQLEAAPDARSDLYGLGVMLFEMVTGELPFPASDLYELLEHHRTTVPSRPSLVAPGLPRALDDLILRALEKDPANRYPDARAMYLQIEELSARLDGGASPASGEGSHSPRQQPVRGWGSPDPADAATSRVVSPSRSSDTTATARPVRRRARISGAPLAVLLVLAGLCALVSFRSRRPAGPRSTVSIAELSEIRQEFQRTVDHVAAHRRPLQAVMESPAASRGDREVGRAAAALAGALTGVEEVSGVLEDLRLRFGPDERAADIVLRHLETLEIHRATLLREALQVVTALKVDGRVQIATIASLRRAAPVAWASALATCAEELASISDAGPSGIVLSPVLTDLRMLDLQARDLPQGSGELGIVRTAREQFDRRMAALRGPFGELLGRLASGVLALDIQPPEDQLRRLMPALMALGAQQRSGTALHHMYGLLRDALVTETRLVRYRATFKELAGRVTSIESHDSWSEVLYVLAVECSELQGFDPRQPFQQNVRERLKTSPVPGWIAHHLDELHRAPVRRAAAAATDREELGSMLAPYRSLEPGQLEVIASPELRLLRRALALQVQLDGEVSALSLVGQTLRMVRDRSSGIGAPPPADSATWQDTSEFLRVLREEALRTVDDPVQTGGLALMLSDVARVARALALAETGPQVREAGRREFESCCRTIEAAAPPRAVPLAALVRATYALANDPFVHAKSERDELWMAFAAVEAVWGAGISPAVSVELRSTLGLIDLGPRRAPPDPASQSGVTKDFGELNREFDALQGNLAGLWLSPDPAAAWAAHFARRPDAVTAAVVNGRRFLNKMDQFLKGRESLGKPWIVDYGTLRVQEWCHARYLLAWSTLRRFRRIARERTGATAEVFGAAAETSPLSQAEPLEPAQLQAAFTTLACELRYLELSPGDRDAVWCLHDLYALGHALGAVPIGPREREAIDAEIATLLERVRPRTGPQGDAIRPVARALIEGSWGGKLPPARELAGQFAALAAVYREGSPQRARLQSLLKDIESGRTGPH